MAQSPDVLLQQMAKSLEEIAKNSSEERKLRLLPQGDRAGTTAAQRSSGSPFSLGGLKDAVGGLPGMDKVGAVMGAAGGALTAFAGAAGAAVSSISELTGMVSQFVNAVNPSIMQSLGRAMHDLNAAIGVAFTGAMQEAVNYVRELGSIIYPLSQEFQPIIRQFAEVMRSLAVPYVQMFATLLSSMAPVLKLFADGLTAVTPLLQAWMHILDGVFKALVEWVGSFFSQDNAQAAMKSFQDGLRNMAKMMIYAAAQIAQYFGASGVLRGIIASLRGGQRVDSTGLGVGSNPQQQDFMSAARQSMLASLLAGSSPEKTKEEKWREEVATTLQNVLNGQSNAIEIALDASMEKLKKAMKEGMMDALGMSEGQSFASYLVTLWAKHLTLPGQVAGALGYR